MRHAIAAVGSILLIVMFTVGLFSLGGNEQALAEGTQVTCEISALTGTVAHIVCHDSNGQEIKVGDLSIPEITVPGPTVTLPGATVKVPGPTVKVPGPTVTAPGPTQTETVRVPEPGPTKTVTQEPRVIERQVEPESNPQTTRTITERPSPRPTVTETTTVTKSPEPSQERSRQGGTNGGTIDEPEEDTVVDIPDIELSLPEAVGLGTAAILFISGLIILGMWAGYYMGYKDSFKSEAKFYRSLLGK